MLKRVQHDGSERLRFLQGFFSLPQQWVLFLFASALLSLSYFRVHHPSSAPEDKGPEVVVEVSGEVLFPGIHFFQTSPTVGEALEKAGGLKGMPFLPISAPERAETGDLITAVKEDPSQIRVRVERMEAKKLLVFSIPLDLNRVSPEDLCLIPGIGESLAREMIACRERRRAFRSVAELREIKGIGEKKYQSISPFLTVRQYP